MTVTWVSRVTARLLKLVALAAVAMASPAGAMEMAIEGPSGPLKGQAIAVDGAQHVVVIVPGSGPTDRDGNTPGSALQTNAYLLLAEALQEAGIASLRVDKRGFFSSEAAIADPNDVTIAAYAEDLRGWVRAAGDLAPCVWIAGHSEGGLVALAMVQTSAEGVCGLLLLATPGRPIGRLLVEQLRANPANAPLMPEIEGIVADLEAGQKRDVDEISVVLRPLFSPGVQDYMIDLFSYDPAVLASHWDGPALILQSDADQQVKSEDASLLARAMPQARKVNIADATHMLKRDVPGQPFITYTDPTLPLHPEVVPAITSVMGN